MKIIMKTKLLSALLISTLVFASCQKDNKDLLEENELKVKFSSGKTATMQIQENTARLGGSVWNIGDAIGIYMLANQTNTIVENAENIPYQAVNDAASTSFIPKTPAAIYYPVNSPASVDFIAYHPYKPLVANWVYPVDVSQQEVQSTIDLMYAAANNAGVGYKKTASHVGLSFEHQLVKLLVNVHLGEGVQGRVTAVQIRGMNNTAKFDLQGIAGLSDYAKPEPITPFTASPGLRYEAILLPAASLTDAHTVTFTTSTGEIYTWAMSQDMNSLEAGSLYSYDITLTKYAAYVEGSISSWFLNTIGSGDAD